MTAPVYAYNRRRDPTSGEVVFDGNRWSVSPAPMAEVVLMVLRTRRGQCLADPTFGVAWDRINKLGTGAAATAKAAIEEALRYLVTAGQIASLTVETAVDVGAGALTYVVSFTDPRLDRRSRINGSI